MNVVHAEEIQSHQQLSELAVSIVREWGTDRWNCSFTQKKVW